MSKDPAFLMYSKDWLEGTADMLPEEKGAYIDLLCYQHQRGELPSDINKLARLARMPTNEFIKIWDGIKDKFERTEERTLNRKLQQVMQERYEKGQKNKIIGTFGYVLKKLNLKKQLENELKKQFNVNEISERYIDWDTERCTEWCQNAIALIEDANEDNNSNTTTSNKSYKYNKFYDEQIKLSDNNYKYTSFVEWMFKKNPNNSPLINVLNMNDQITFERLKYYTENYSSELIKTTIIDLEKSTKKYKSFNLTLNNWIKNAK